MQYANEMMNVQVADVFSVFDKGLPTNSFVGYQMILALTCG